VTEDAKGRFLAVARINDGLPIVVQGSVYPDTEEGRDLAHKHAWRLFNSAKQRVPFQIVEIRTLF